MAFDKKPSEKTASYLTATDALRDEGPIGRIDREAFTQHLSDPEVRDRLDSARRMWNELYGRDPASSGPAASA